MNIECDKFLTEIMGERWFEHKSIYGIEHSASGDKFMYQTVTPNDFSTWDGFGKLFEWAIKQSWWKDFEYDYSQTFYVINSCVEHRKFSLSLINPNNFSNSIYEYLKGIKNE